MALHLERDYDFDFVISAKRRIRDILLADHDVTELLKDDISEEELSKLNMVDHPYIGYSYIVPFPFIPVALTKETCYICMKVDTELYDLDNPFSEVHYIVFTIFCSPVRQDFKQGINRLDALAYCLVDLFEFSNPLGLEWQLTENIENVLTAAGSAGFLSRTLEFRSMGVATKNRAKNKKVGSRSGLSNPYTNVDDTINPAMMRDRQGVEKYTDVNL